jgi:hypothetical protein
MNMKKIFHHPFFIRLMNWEYWPFGAVYFWTFPAWLFFCLRSRSFFFFSASNPSIENGGLIGESKKNIHDVLPLAYYPKTVHFAHAAGSLEVLKKLHEAGLVYPMIGKPDIGGRGRAVKLLRNEQDVILYAEKALIDYHIQEYISYPLEVGIFYYRFPDADKGKISGIVGKEFLTVKGNGKDTLLELLKADSRSIMYLKSLEAMHQGQLDEVIPAGEEKMVSPYGNHARGSKFLDVSGWSDLQLEETMDAISKNIPGFYFGRFDIRYTSWDLLKQGKEFIIIEVNGAGAEPTHMYDPKHSVFFAWKEIIRHWNIMEKISRENHKKGVPYLSFSQGIKMFREDKKNSKTLVAMSEQIQ